MPERNYRFVMLFIFCLFAARVLAGVVAELDYSEPNWTFRIAVLALAAGEMVLLIVGLTGIGMLHGWTEGIGYHMREYYTPLWLCAVLMCLLLALVISLFFVFVCLHCNHPGIIKQHIILLMVMCSADVSITGACYFAFLRIRLPSLQSSGYY
ncbi:hypothetical protein COOONC_10522 [Cooperia oncophora]